MTLSTRLRTERWMLVQLVNENIPRREQSANTAAECPGIPPRLLCDTLSHALSSFSVQGLPVPPSACHCLSSCDAVLTTTRTPRGSVLVPCS